MKNTVLYIQSVHNPLVKQVVLLQQPKQRKKQAVFIAQGIRTITTMVESPLLILEYIFAVQEHELLAYSVAQKETTIIICSQAVMDKISTLTSCPGLVAIFREPVCQIDLLKGPGIVLAQIADPGNMGTLIRSAAAFNIKTVVVVEGVDPWSPKVVQASAGTIGMINLCVLSWQELVQQCCEKQIALNALVVSQEETGYCQEGNQFLVVGNEAHGLPDQWQQDCQLKTTIAMPGNVESLNVAVAGSIALYELVKNEKNRQ